MQEEKDSKNLIEELFEDESRPISKSERTRLKIMASAAKVFTEKGFDNASIQDIADDAGVAKGTIYYYIDKKEDILLSLVKLGKAHLFGRVEKGIDRIPTASGKLELIIGNHLKLMSTVSPAVLFFAQSLMTPGSKVKELMQGFREDYLGLLESIIKEGIDTGEFRQVDPKETAVTLLSMVIGQMLQHRLFVGRINAKAITGNIMSIALRGLMQRHED